MRKECQILRNFYRNYIRLYTKNKILSYKNKSRRSSILVKVILNFYNQA